MQQSTSQTRSHGAISNLWRVTKIAAGGVTAWLAVTAAIPAGAQQVLLSFTQDMAALPGDLRLVWDSVPDALYRVQTTTNISDPTSWQTLDVVTTSSNKASYGVSSRLAPAAQPRAAQFYRLVVPQPQILGVEPSFVSSSGGTAALYILGQLLPNNAKVVIDGQSFTPTIINSNGVWASVSLNGLPPGAVTGPISVIDNGTGTTVATLSPQSPVLYGTAESNEQLQGPPDDLPARPAKKKGVTESNLQVQIGYVTLDRTAAGHAWDNKPRYSQCRIFSPTGEFRCQETDLAVPGRGLDFAWTRTYLSRTGPTTAQGAGWDFSYNVTIAVPPDGTVVLSTGDGRSQTFYPNATGGWARDEYFIAVGDLNGDGMPDVAFPDGGKWLFKPLGTAAGKLWQIIDRNGNTMTLGYDGSGRLSTVVDTLDRTNNVAYNSSGQIASVTDFSGRTVSYLYDSNGNLVACVSTPVTGTPTGNDFPGGKTNSYTYSSGFSDSRLNHNLTSMTDGKEQTWLQVVYQATTDPASIDFDAVDHLQRGSYTEYLRRYAQTPAPTNQFATVESILCDAVGNVSECYYDSRLRCVRELEYTGRSNPALPVTQTANRPSGQLRSTDPAFFETVWSWNNDSLLTSVNLNPRSVPRQQFCLYQRDFTDASNPLHKGDLRVFRDLASSPVDTAGDGVTDTTQRSWFFAYDPRFGSPAYCVQYRESDLNCTAYVSPNTGKAMSITWSGSGGSGDNPMESIMSRAPTGRRRHIFLSPASALGLFGSPASCVQYRESDLYRTAYVSPNTGKAMGILWSGSGGSGDSPMESLMARGPSGRRRHTALSAASALSLDGGDDNPKESRSLVNSGRWLGLSPDAARAWDGTIKGTARMMSRGPWQTVGMSAAGSSNLRGNHKDCVAAVIQEYTYPELHSHSHELLSLAGKGWDGTIKGCGIADLDRDGRSDFAVSVTDPNGITTTATFDARGNRVKVQFPWDRPGVDFSYNTHGQCVAVTNEADANGYRSMATFSYYTNGPQAGFLQSATADALGLAQITSFEYDVLDNLTRCVDPRGNDCLYSYNALDQLVSFSSPTNINSRCATDCVYDANDNLVTTTTEFRDATDTLQHTVAMHLTYDALDRCTAVADQVNPAQFVTNGLAYDGNDCVTAFYSPMATSGADPNNYITNQYDERCFVMKQTDSSSPSLFMLRRLDYDYDGNCTTITVSDATGSAEVTACAYDGLDRRVQITDAMGNIEAATYDRNDALILDRCYGAAGATGRQLLAQISFQYDAGYRPVLLQCAHFDASGSNLGKGYATTSFAYAPNCALLSVTDDNLHSVSFAYDTLGRCSQITDPRNDALQFVYDASDNVTSATSVEASDFSSTLEQFSISYSYDSQDRCVQSKDNVGNTSSYAYDSLHRLVRCTSPNKNLAGFAYDDLGRCTIAVADLDRDGVLDFARDARNVMSWDDNSRCVSRTDANTNSAFYGYDSLNDCVAVTNADATVSVFTYNGFGNLITSVDPNGTAVSNIFDLDNRLVHRDIAARNVLPTTSFESFSYDGLSRLTAASNDTSSCSFTYDSLDDCLTATQDGLTTTDSYDGVGNLLSISYPSGRVVTYTYDALNEVASVSSSTPGTAPLLLASYAYEGPGRVGKVTRANGITTRIAWEGQAGAANPPGDFGWRQVAAIAHAANPQAIVDQRRFAYDADQDEISRAQVAPFFSGGPRLTNTFAYDALDRLTAFSHLSGAAGDYSTTYTLDGNGNRQSANKNGVPSSYTMNDLIPPGDFEMDRYTVTPFGSQTYDADGSLASRNSATGELQYQYDYAGRLVAVKALTGGLPAPVASFSYDALGRRVSKTTYAGVPPVPAVTRFVHAGDWSVLEENQNGLLTHSYVHASDDSGTLPDKASGFLALADLNQDDRMDLVAAFTAAGAAIYYHGDDLGNTLALTDANGAVLERTDYDDYGTPTFLSSDGTPLVDGSGQPLMSSSQGNPFLFREMFWDGETGLYLSSSRRAGDYLDPSTGRARMSSVRDNPLYKESGRQGVNLLFEPKETSIALGDNRYSFARSNPWSPATPSLPAFMKGDFSRGNPTCK
jgi:YD repeat-containing protein